MPVFECNSRARFGHAQSRVRGDESDFGQANLAGHYLLFLA